MLIYLRAANSADDIGKPIGWALNKTEKALDDK